LELARHFAGDRPKRSIAFVAFSAEELGLLGSAHFVKEGPLPLQGAVAMFNMDMIGRLAANDTLIVQGTGTAPEWGALLDTAVEGLPIAINRTEDGVGPSDQTSFVAQRIPVLSFFTGAHDDYHRPSDDADKINYPGEVAILTLVSRVLGAVSRGEASPTYTEVAGGTDPHQGGVDTSRGFNVYLGTIPDYSVSDKLILQGVREGGPGWEAGLRAGDQLTRFGDIEINNVYDYTYALQTYQPGDIVDVLVKRGEETLTITMTLRSKGEGEASASGAHGDPHSNPQGAGGQPGDDAHGHGEGESGEDEGTTPHGHHHHDSAVVM
ncbi:MAG TPA: M28 family peptidase, partial [bacterium]|nr:M28 family peptidase [bacterium]